MKHQKDLIRKPDTYKQMIDFFTREEFDGISSDELFYEAFLKYFREYILGSYSTSDIFLSDDEKTLQYAGRNNIEATMEYELLVNKHLTHIGKVYYAEKGGRFCIVFPVLRKPSDKKYYSQRAKQFYRTAVKFSESEISAALYRFVSRITHDITNSLENILKNIKIDGKNIMEKIYGETIALYWTENNQDKSKEYAKTLVEFARKLNIDGDDIPLKREHYKYLFMR